MEPTNNANPTIATGHGKSSYKLVGAIIGVAVLVGLVYLYETSGLGHFKKTHVGAATGVSLKYPWRMALAVDSSRFDDEPVDVAYFSGQGVLLTIASQIRSASSTATERTFYESILFPENGSHSNTRFAVAGFEGYRSAIDGTILRYTLYKELAGSDFLILRTEVAASSTNMVDTGEKVLLEMVSRLKVKDVPAPVVEVAVE